LSLNSEVPLLNLRRLQIMQMHPYFTDASIIPIMANGSRAGICITEQPEHGG
jgi:hypothetical protein